MENKSITFVNKEFESIFKDYTYRLNEKFESDKAQDINNLVIFFNWCFLFKNSFFVDKFNNKYIHNVCESYNTLKTNILEKTNNSDIFENISVPDLRRLKFILYNYIQNFEKINSEPKNKMLCSTVTLDSIRNCVYYINEKINNKTNKILEKL